MMSVAVAPVFALALTTFSILFEVFCSMIFINFFLGEVYFYISFTENIDVGRKQDVKYIQRLSCEISVYNKGT